MTETPKNVINLRDEVQEYKKFAFGKSMIGVAVALVLANIVQKLVNGISEGILMPIINFFVGQTSGSWRSLILVPVEGMNLEIGKLVAVFIEFLITTIILYVVYSRIVKRIEGQVKN